VKFVLAPDSFKESMTAAEAASAMAEGVRAVYPDAECVEVPMSDGGEGFAQAVAGAWGAEWVEVDTVDALGRPIRAGYGLADGRAVLDMASSCGLELVAPEDRDVARSTTAGLGVVLRDALARGARRLVIGIGGSATNDAGAGMLVQLGARLLSADGAELAGTPRELARVASVDAARVAELFAGVDVQVACDVTNPLNGPRGATAVFGPQKGVSAADVAAFDDALARFAEAAGAQESAAAPGAGAAGGLGFALQEFLGARLRPGVELVADAVGLAAAVRDADLVLTGEGAVDSQTLEGKTPAGVALVAQRAGVGCIVFAGRVRPGAEVLLEHGVDALVQIVDSDAPLALALAEGPRNLAAATAETLGSWGG
jgi:glycerate kinase